MGSLTRRDFMKSATAAVTFFTAPMGFALAEQPGAGKQAQAGKCRVDDRLHPGGTACKPGNEVSCESAGEKEPWCTGAKAVTEIGFVSASKVTYDNTAKTSDPGVTAMLSQLHHQFDMLYWDSDFSQYKVLILADEHRLSRVHKEKVESYLAGGGKLLLSYQSGMDPDGRRFVLDQMGVKYIKAFACPGDEGNYLEALGSFAEGFPAMPNFTFGSVLWVEPLAGTNVVARFWKPEFEHMREQLSAHAQNRESDPAEFPAVTEHGNVIYLTFPVFTSYALQENPVQRHTVKNCITRFLPEPLVRIDAPSYAEVTVTAQGPRRIVHILCRKADAGVGKGAVSLYNVKLALRATDRPSRVYLAPQKIDLKFEYTEGYAELMVPEVDGHQMIVFES